MEEQKSVDWTGFGIKEQAKPGSIEKAIIVSVKKGKVKELIKEEYHKEWSCGPEGDLLEIIGESDNGSIKVRKIVGMPLNPKAISPKSSLGKWKSRYGKFPETGDMVSITANASGYWEFIL